MNTFTNDIIEELLNSSHVEISNVIIFLLFTVELSNLAHINRSWNQPCSTIFSKKSKICFMPFYWVFFLLLYYCPFFRYYKLKIIRQYFYLNFYSCYQTHFPDYKTFSLQEPQKLSKAQISVLISQPLFYVKSVHSFPLKILQQKSDFLMFEHQF